MQVDWHNYISMLNINHILPSKDLCVYVQVLYTARGDQNPPSFTRSGGGEVALNEINKSTLQPTMLLLCYWLPGEIVCICICISTIQIWTSEVIDALLRQVIYIIYVGNIYTAHIRLINTRWWEHCKHGISTPREISIIQYPRIQGCRKLER